MEIIAGARSIAPALVWSGLIPRQCRVLGFLGLYPALRISSQVEAGGTHFALGVSHIVAGAYPLKPIGFNYRMQSNIMAFFALLVCPVVHIHAALAQLGST